jgi:hypothetical protein
MICRFFRSVDYLKSLLSFPKHLIDAGMLEALTEEVIQHHDEVHDVTQAAAEELYISLCQQLDGYGQETFIARNEEGVEVMLGISVSGVIVGYSGSSTRGGKSSTSSTTNEPSTSNAPTRIRTSAFPCKTPRLGGTFGSSA